MSAYPKCNAMYCPERTEEVRRLPSQKAMRHAPATNQWVAGTIVAVSIEASMKISTRPASENVETLSWHLPDQYRLVGVPSTTGIGSKLLGKLALFQSTASGAAYTVRVYAISADRRVQYGEPILGGYNPSGPNISCDSFEKYQKTCPSSIQLHRCSRWLTRLVLAPRRCLALVLSQCWH